MAKVMDKNITFEYPLYSTLKRYIVRDIIDLNLSNCVWTCENPTDDLKPCGFCHTCQNLDKALIDEMYHNKSINMEKLNKWIKNEPEDDIKSVKSEKEE